MGVSFQFNDTVIKIDRELNTRRNTGFMGNGDKMEQNNDVTLISPPTMLQKLKKMKTDEEVGWQ